METSELIHIDRALVDPRDLHDFLLTRGSVARKKRLVSQRQTVVRLRGNLVGPEPIHPARVADDGLPSGLLHGASAADQPRIRVSPCVRQGRRIVKA